jgi:hypothetical protein
VLNSNECAGLLTRIQNHALYLEPLITRHKRTKCFRINVIPILQLIAVLMIIHQHIAVLMNNQHTSEMYDNVTVRPLLMLLRMIFVTVFCLNQYHSLELTRQHYNCVYILMSVKLVIHCLLGEESTRLVSFICCYVILHPMHNSRLSSIHIIAAFNSLDRSTYGFDKILAPVVRDIQAA